MAIKVFILLKCNTSDSGNVYKNDVFKVFYKQIDMMKFIDENSIELDNKNRLSYEIETCFIDYRSKYIYYTRSKNDFGNMTFPTIYFDEFKAKHHYKELVSKRGIHNIELCKIELF